VAEFVLTDESTETSIGLALGAASMCWEHPERAGEFDSDRALVILTELTRHLRRLRLLPEVR
jgi:hypothetical protein